MRSDVKIETADGKDRLVRIGEHYYYGGYIVGTLRKSTDTGKYDIVVTGSIGRRLRLNAFCTESIEQLDKCVNAIEVVVTGAGPLAFIGA